MHKILVIGYVWPEPNSSAAGSRMMELLKLFHQQHWEVVFASASALSEHRADVSSLGIPEKQIVLNCASFDAFLLQFQPDMVLFDRFFTEEQFGWRVEKYAPNALRVLDTVDLHSLRHCRQQLFKQAQSRVLNQTERHQLPAMAASAEQLRTAMAHDDLAQREIAAIFRCDLSLLISQPEVELLHKHFAVPLEVLHFCNLMLIPVAQKALDFHQRSGFFSIGNFRHAPNWDAVLWLKHAIWPKIREKIPDAQLSVAGAYPPPKLNQLHKPSEGFHVLGWIADAQQAMAQARVCLAPLRFGAGIKGKLADAMACATPSVTTSIGSEGMDGGLAWGGLIADDSAGFAAAAVQLYQQQDLWQQSQQHAELILQQVFCREDAARDLINRLQQARQQQNENRQNNFIGSMLRHHLLKSTQYMSQWISVKNQMAGLTDAHQLTQIQEENQDAAV